MVNSWYSPSLVSPSGRSMSVMQLMEHADGGAADIQNPFLEETKWEDEAMVLAHIVRRTEEEEEEESCVADTAGHCSDEDEDEGPIHYGEQSDPDTSVVVFSAQSDVDNTPGAKRVLVKANSSRTDESLPTHGSIKERQKIHHEMGTKCFSSFVCRCTVAKARNTHSCLDQFSREHFRRWHHETYGVSVSGDSVSSCSIDIQAAIHHKIWALKEPIGAKTSNRGDVYGRAYMIRQWKLDGHVVCKKAWQLAVGGSQNMHKTLYSLVCRGHGPGDAAAQVQVKQMRKKVEAVLDAKGVQDNPRRGFAAQWWKNYLLLCDWLPNEQKIQIRGPSYDWLHRNAYGPVAHHANLHLSYKTWMSCKPEGLVLVALLLKDANPQMLKASRSARHSK